MRRRYAPIVVCFVLLACGALPALASASVPHTWITAGPSGTIGVDSATFEFTSPEAHHFQCRLDSHDWEDWKPCGSPKTYSSLADGPHVFEVRAVIWYFWVDPTPAVAHFTVAAVPPETDIVSAPSGTIAEAEADFAFASSQEGSFECRLDSSDESAWGPCGSPQSFSGLADGQHTLEVRAVNSGGAVDPTPAVVTFTVDTTPPQTSITSGPSGTIGETSVSFSFVAGEKASFKCRLDSSDEAAWTPCGSPRAYSGLGDGAHSFEVRATDSVGNVDPTPAVANFTIYTGPPPPVAGSTVDLEPVEGNVELICPGESTYSKLTSFKQVPLGCLVNTRQGVVNLVASKGQSGELQGAHFWGGVFITAQEAGDNKELELKLAGKRKCERQSRKPRKHKLGKKGKPHKRATASAGRHGGRKLWGSGKGNFKTSGSYGSATVRGTTWLVVDRCDGSTLIKVGEGTVWVEDFVKHKTLILTTGQEYLAKADIPRLAPGT